MDFLLFKTYAYVFAEADRKGRVVVVHQTTNNKQKQTAGLFGFFFLPVTRSKTCNQQPAPASNISHILKLNHHAA
jgi:hypothetical protein